MSQVNRSECRVCGYWIDCSPQDHRSDCVGFRTIEFAERHYCMDCNSQFGDAYYCLHCIEQKDKEIARLKAKIAYLEAVRYLRRSPRTVLDS
jgi:hypothetical protein